MHHETFPYPINRLALDVMNKELTVASEGYGAFFEYDEAGYRLVPVEGTDEDAAKASPNIFRLFIDFVKQLLSIMKRIMNGELSLEL